MIALGSDGFPAISPDLKVRLQTFTIVNDPIASVPALRMYLPRHLGCTPLYFEDLPEIQLEHMITMPPVPKGIYSHWIVFSRNTIY